MDFTTILLTTSAAIIASLITAYVTTRLSAKQELIKWERELAQKLAEHEGDNSVPEEKTVRTNADRLARQFAVGYILFEINESQREKIFIPRVGRMLIGRRDRESVPDIDLSAAGAGLSISRKHAMIEVEDSGVFLVDLGSAAGTFVNNQRLQPNSRQKLDNGDMIQLGEMELTFHSLSRLL